MNGVPGDYVECGVYRGGNIKGMMAYALDRNDLRNVWLYDTFAGMTPPLDLDVDLGGNKAKDILNSVMCLASLEEVKNNLSDIKYPETLSKYVIGDICQTVMDDKNVPESISLLRLDTDWYESTKIELQRLYPRLVPGGVLIIDDYGHWQGCRKAVDEYFANTSVIFKRIDYTGVMLIKS